MTKYSIGVLSDPQEGEVQELIIFATINSKCGNARVLKDVVVSLLAQYTGEDITVMERDDCPDSVVVDEEEMCETFCPAKTMKRV